MQGNLSEITHIAEQIASSFGLSVVEVKVGQQGRNRTLEVTIYRPGSRISLDDCENVSRQMEAALDQQSPPLLDGSYMLEVQSPGIDRKLSSQREFDIFRGQPVEVKTKQKVEGLGSAFTGKLVGYENDSVLIEHPEKISDRPKNKKGKASEVAPAPSSITVEMSNIISVRLIPQMPQNGADDSESATELEDSD